MFSNSVKHSLQTKVELQSSGEKVFSYIEIKIPVHIIVLYRVHFKYYHYVTSYSTYKASPGERRLSHMCVFRDIWHVHACGYAQVACTYTTN